MIKINDTEVEVRVMQLNQNHCHTLYQTSKYQYHNSVSFFSQIDLQYTQSNKDP